MAMNCYRSIVQLPGGVEYRANPDCDNCYGWGWVDIHVRPPEPCVFCMDDAILRGKIDGMIWNTTYVKGVAQ